MIFSFFYDMACPSILDCQGHCYYLFCVKLSEEQTTHFASLSYSHRDHKEVRLLVVHKTRYKNP